MTIRKRAIALFSGLVLLTLSACMPIVPPLPSTGDTSTPVSASTIPVVVTGGLENTHWQLESMGPVSSPEPALAGTNVTLNFESNSQVSGNGGCNSFGGSYQLQDGSISFTQVVHTEMACLDQGRSQQEGQFFQALLNTGQYQVNGDRLRIQYNNGQDALHFVQAGAAPEATSVGSEGRAGPNPTVGSPSGTVVSNPTPAPVIPNSDQYPYIDNRSGPVEVLTSLFNAINRKEYDRAYSYWQSGVSDLPPYDQFKAGYANTKSVQLFTGPISGGVGAGQYYYSVPTVLVSQTTGGETQTFAGCYILHLANPIIQDAPPYHPMSIQSANIQQVKNVSDPASVMPGSCGQ